jgi:hypothetical protein
MTTVGVRARPRLTQSRLYFGRYVSKQPDVDVVDKLRDSFHVGWRRVEPSQAIVLFFRRRTFEQRIAHLSLNALGVVEPVHHQ